MVRIPGMRPVRIRVLLLAACPLALAFAGGCPRDTADEGTKPQGERGEPSTTAEAAATPAPAGRPESRGPATRATDPCASLDEATLRKLFRLPEATKILARPGRTACVYVWERPNADELRAEIEQRHQARIAALMKAARQRKAGEGQVDPQTMLEALGDIPSLESRVTVVDLPDRYATAAASKAGFEEMIAKLERGMSQPLDEHAGGGTVTFQADYEPVGGVPGDDARWSPKLRQLSILDGRRILHITVEVAETPRENLAAAREIARLVLAGDDPEDEAPAP